MGVFHFMGIGKSIGVVTCAVDYIEKSLDTLAQKEKSSENIIKLFSGSGGINHQETDKGKIEALVLFTSKEVIERNLEAYSYAGNDRPTQVRDELLKVLKKVWKRGDKDIGRKVYWCEVEIDNFRDCLDKVIKVAYRFSPTGKQGKEIWCNLTGGTNAINLALVSMSRLTGVSTTNYLISQRKDYQKEIQLPQGIKVNPNQDDYFNTLPFLKTHIDTIHFYDILHVIKNNNKIHKDKLLGILKGKTMYFQDVNEERLKKDFLLKLYGLGYTNFDEQGYNWITTDGIFFLDELDIIQDTFDVEDLLNMNINMVEESKSWKWFKEIDNLDK